MEVKIEPTFGHVTWILKDFLKLPQKGDSYLDSPEFVFNGDTYCLRLYPNMSKRTTDFHLRRLRETLPKREFSYEIGIKVRESNGDDYYNYAAVALETNRTFYRSSFEKDRDKYLPDSSLTIVCSMRLSEDSRTGSSAKEEGDQGELIKHDNNILFRRLPSMELSTEFPCAYVHLTVPKFFDLPREASDSLTSPEFRFAGDTYCFRFCPNDYTHDTDLQLVRLTFSMPDRTVSNRVGYWWGGYCRYPKNSRPLVGNKGFCITRSELEKERQKYVSNDTLRLCLVLRTGKRSVDWKRGRSVDEAWTGTWTGLSGIRKLQSDYRQLLQKGTESDACVVVCGKDFKVHKNVLRARSTVFEAIFSHETTEKESGRVVIDDIDPKTFGVFLEYLYTGDVGAGLSDDNAFGLYEVAHKYDVSTLKSDCVEHMHRTLSADSFCDVLTLALRHHEEDLLQSAICFFKVNFQHIIITPKWQQFMSANSTSANELLIKALMSGKQ